MKLFICCADDEREYKARVLIVTRYNGPSSRAFASVKYLLVVLGIAKLAIFLHG